VVFDALGEQLQRLLFLVGAEVLVGADAEGDGVGLFLDGVGGLQQEVTALAVLVVAGEGVRLVNAIRRSLSKDQKALPFWIGGSLAGSPDDT